MRKNKGDKKLNKRYEPGSGFSSSRSVIAQAARGGDPKMPNFAAVREQKSPPIEQFAGKMLLPATSIALPSDLQQIPSAHAEDENNEKHTSGQTRRRKDYFGYFDTSSESLKEAQPLFKLRAGDIENVRFNHRNAKSGSGTGPRKKKHFARHSTSFFRLLTYECTISLTAGSRHPMAPFL